MAPDVVYAGIDIFEFTAVGDNGIDYTGQATFVVDNIEIDGNTFDPPAVGDYDVFAKIGDIIVSPVIVASAISLNLTVEATPNPTFIELDPFEFTATGINGIDYTAQAIFFVDNVEIAGSSFDPTIAGDYEVYAKIGDVITSPIIIATAAVGYTSLTLTVSETIILETQTLVFSAEDNLGRNLSASATYYVNGVAVTGSNYTATLAGVFEVYAIFDAIQSNTENFTVVAPSYTTKILVEDYTGSWCGYWPRLWWKLEDAVAQNANIIPAAIHDDTPMKYENADSMESTFGITGFPSGRINRTISWNESESQLNNIQSKLSGLGLGINSTKTGNSIAITVKVGFDLSYTEEVKLVLYLLENELIYDQVNYYNNDSSTPVYGLGDPIPNFQHDNVVRKAYTNIYGDVIPSAETVNGSIYSRTFNVDIPMHSDGDNNPSNVENSDNIHLIAFVIDASGEVINVQKAEINEDKDFD